MKTPGPFDYVKSINKKEYMENLSGYNPFLTNRAFASFIDTIMFAEQMNQYPGLSPYLQYQFYYYGVSKRSRFDPITKPTEPEGLKVVMDYYKYSKQKALEVIRILSQEDILNMSKSMDKGGHD